ncbi:MAG: D-aminoacyl-tRNA deacylase [Candidatus Kapabacteria bacterium]|nr:D-aminoacyl-tRNA deacylase [Candidatus Kapabacteria bacterium]
MRIVIQRVSSAHVDVDGQTVGSIDHGLLALVGISHKDTSMQVAWMAEKILALRIFPDDDRKMNLSIKETGGGILLVSQFTLYGDVSKGTRPSFVDAARPEHAQPLFDELVKRVHDLSRDAPSPISIATGVFGAMMDVHLVNNGPVTILLER